MLAKDIMTAEVVSVGTDTTVNEIARILHEKKISAVPVVNENSELLGVVTEEDLIHKVAKPHIPLHIELLGGILYFEKPQTINDELKKLMGRTASEIMTKKVATVGEEAPVEDIAALMLDEQVNWIPVVKGKTLAGVITRLDILKAV
ncbi:MAG: CBS domain-containing protein [Firmicutes bacterium]|nr:CBS domain-containing protein [Bacillota bacterium]